MTKYKAGIFDLDDTLYSYRVAHPMAMSVVCQLGCERTGLDNATFNTAFVKARSLVKGRLGNVGASHNRLLYFQNLLEILGEQPVGLALELFDCYWEVLLEKMTLFPGVMQLFEEMKKRDMVIAICSDMTSVIQFRKLIKLGISEFIDVVVTSEESGLEKPDESSFRLCLEKLNVNADECFFVGDSYQKDVLGAMRLDMPVFWLGGDGTKQSGVQSVSSFANLHQILFE